MSSRVALQPNSYTEEVMPEQQIPSAWRKHPKLVTTALSGLVKKSAWPQVQLLGSV